MFVNGFRSTAVKKLEYNQGKYVNLKSLTTKPVQTEVIIYNTPKIVDEFGLRVHNMYDEPDFSTSKPVRNNPAIELPKSPNAHKTTDAKLPIHSKSQSSKNSPSAAAGSHKDKEFPEGSNDDDETSGSYSGSDWDSTSGQDESIDDKDSVPRSPSSAMSHNPEPQKYYEVKPSQRPESSKPAAVPTKLNTLSPSTPTKKTGTAAASPSLAPPARSSVPLIKFPPAWSRSGPSTSSVYTKTTKYQPKVPTPRQNDASRF